MSGDPTWDLLNNSCSTLSGFVTSGSGTYSHAITTVDGRVCIRMTVTASSTSYAYIWATGIPNTNHTTQAIFARESDDTASTYCVVYRRDASTRVTSVWIGALSAPIGKYTMVDPTATGGAGRVRVSVDASANNWHTIRFVASGTQVSGYFDNQYLETRGPIEVDTGYAPSGVGFQLYAITNSPARTVFIDWIGVSATVMDPTPNNYAVTISGTSKAVVMARQYSGSGWTTAGGGVSVFHTSGPVGDTSYSLRLVPTTHADASPVRILTSTGVQAVMKHKTF